LPEPCYIHANPNTFNAVVGFLVLLGSIVAYIPQIVKLWQLGSNEGLSPLSITLANVSGLASMLLSINANWNRILCCRVVNFYECSRMLLAFYQYVVIFVSWLVIWISYLSLFPVHLDKVKAEEQLRTQRTLTAIFWVWYILAMLVSMGIFVWNFFFSANDWLYQTVNFVLGIGASIVQTFIWLPQVWSTWKQQDPGALSLVMLAFLFPGSGLTIYVQIVYGAPVLVWFPAVISGVCQLMLIAMLILFWYRKRRQAAIIIMAQTTAETRPLLHDPESTSDASASETGSTRPLKTIHGHLSEDSGDIRRRGKDEDERPVRGEERVAALLING